MLHCVFSRTGSPVHLNSSQPAQQQGQPIGHFHTLYYRYPLLYWSWCMSTQVPKPRTTLCNSFPVLKQFGKNELFFKTRYEANPKLPRLDKIK